jgi:hypothetical protein
MTDLLVTDVLVVGEGCALTPRRARPADAVGPCAPSEGSET